MKKIAIVLAVIVALFAYTHATATTLTLNKTPVRVYFSPDGGCTDAIIKEIDNAKADIYVQAYSFTSTPVARALIAAFKRGVRVEAILDRSQRTAKYSSATFLANMRIPTYIDDKHALGAFVG